MNDLTISFIDRFAPELLPVELQRNWTIDMYRFSAMI
jgi:hypothetical protein